MPYTFSKWREIPEDTPIEFGKKYRADIVFQSTKTGDELRRDMTLAVNQALAQASATATDRRVEATKITGPQPLGGIQYGAQVEIIAVPLMGGQGQVSATGVLLTLKVIGAIIKVLLLAVALAVVIALAWFIITGPLPGVVDWLIPLAGAIGLGFLAGWLIRKGRGTHALAPV